MNDVFSGRASSTGCLTSLQVGNDQFCDVLMKIRGPDGPEAVRQWQHLQVMHVPIRRNPLSWSHLMRKRDRPGALLA